MDVEAMRLAIREHSFREPFLPYVIAMHDGSSIVVNRPMAVAVGPVIAIHAGRKDFAEFEIADVARVTTVDALVRATR